jgi:MoxR-like ATPase
MTDPLSRIRAALGDAAHGLVDREVLLELVALGAIAGEHVLVVGPPGTAKSEAVRRMSRAFGGRSFEYLLGRFTEPGELFGPVDFARLRDGVVEVRTEGMLPEADFVFLDEVFLGSTAILNTLLGVLNDRTYRRGHTIRRCPLRVCVGASNALPSDEALAAFSDRFLLRVFVHPTGDDRLEDLLEAGAAGPRPDPMTASLDDLDAIAAIARRVDVSPVRERIAEAVRLLRRDGIALSDRRAVKLQRLVAAAAALAGREHATAADLWPMIYAVPDEAGQEAGRGLLRALLADAENPALPGAAEDASAGRLARARRLITASDAITLPVDGPGRLKVEGILREIDAGFAAADRPPELDSARERLRQALA